MAVTRRKKSARVVSEAVVTVGKNDLETLPTLFRLFASETRDALGRIEDLLSSLVARVSDLERRVTDVEKRLNERTAA